MGRKKQKAVADNNQNVKDLLEEYIDEKSTLGLSKQTIESIRNSSKRFFECFGDEITTDKIDEGLLITFTRMLRNKDIALASINHYLRDLRTFVNWCYENGYIDEKIVVRMVKGQQLPKDTYTDEEILALLEKPKAKANYVEWRDWAIVNWIYGTGNRIGTLIDVRMSDIDLKKANIVIRAQKNKTASSIPMDRKLVAVLREYIKRDRPNARGEDYLFTNIYGEPLTTKAVQQSMAKYNKNRGVNKTSCHALRHTFAKNWICNGGNVFQLQHMLGHKSLQVTRSYVNLYGADLKEGFDDVSPLSNIKKQKGGSRKGRLTVED